MKVLFYNHTGQVSGAERLLLTILTRLDRDRFEPVVVCPEQDSLSEMVSKLDVPVATIASLDARFTWRLDQLAAYCRSFFEVIRQLRQKVTNRNPDLLHANSIRAGLVATVATFGLQTRVIWHLHDLLPRHPLSTFIRLLALFSLRSRMIAVSEAVATNFLGRFSSVMKNRVVVILNAIDLDHFRPDPTARRRLRRELRVRETDSLIGIVGQITPRKGQLELVCAFAEALTRISPTILVVAGKPLFNQDGEYMAAVERAATERAIRSSVRMLGARNDVAAIMQALDVLVVNSKAEPFGLVIIEAMACGTPVLATAVDGIPEIIQHGKNGWLFAVGDEEALAEGLIHLSQHPYLRKRLAANAKQHVVANFSAERLLSELQNFYFDCINSSAADEIIETAGPSEPEGVPAGVMLSAQREAGMPVPRSDPDPLFALPTLPHGVRRPNATTFRAS